MSEPFITQDGTKLVRINKEPLKAPLVNPFYHCDCHQRMGNDFFFLPMSACLRAGNECTNPKGQGDFS